MNFFITGLPRSRTAWLANLFTFKNSFCFHELSRVGSDPAEIYRKLQTRREDHVGSADQLLPYYIDYMTERVENYKIVVIKRPKIQCKLALANWMGYADYEIESKIDALDKRIDKMQAIYETKTIPYEALDDPYVIEDLWYHCLPSVPFDEDRFNMLNEFNIQLMKEKYLHKLNGKEVRKLMEA